MLLPSETVYSVSLHKVPVCKIPSGGGRPTPVRTTPAAMSHPEQGLGLPWLASTTPCGHRLAVEPAPIVPAGPIRLKSGGRAAMTRLNRSAAEMA